MDANLIPKKIKTVLKRQIKYPNIPLHLIPIYLIKMIYIVIIVPS